MIVRVIENNGSNKGRTNAYTGKGADHKDKFLAILQRLEEKYMTQKFWTMLEKEYKDDRDKIVFSACKYDSSSGSLAYCGTTCLQK